MVWDLVPGLCNYTSRHRERTQKSADDPNLAAYTLREGNSLVWAEGASPVLWSRGLGAMKDATTRRRNRDSGHSRRESMIWRAPNHPNRFGTSSTAKAPLLELRLLTCLVHTKRRSATGGHSRVLYAAASAYHPLRSLHAISSACQGGCKHPYFFPVSLVHDKFRNWTTTNSCFLCDGLRRSLAPGLRACRVAR